MSTLGSILLKIDGIGDSLGKGFKLALTDTLPEDFSGLSGGESFSCTDSFVEYFSLDISNEGMGVGFYVDVILVEKDGNSHKVEVRFGESEEGNIDLDVIEVRDGNSYEEMLCTLDDYINHLWGVVERL